MDRGAILSQQSYKDAEFELFCTMIGALSIVVRRERRASAARRRRSVPVKPPQSTLQQPTSGGSNSSPLPLFAPVQIFVHRRRFNWTEFRRSATMSCERTSAGLGPGILFSLRSDLPDSACTSVLLRPFGPVGDYTVLQESLRTLFSAKSVASFRVRKHSWIGLRPVSTGGAFPPAGGLPVARTAVRRWRNNVFQHTRLLPSFCYLRHKGPPGGARSLAGRHHALQRESAASVSFVRHHSNTCRKSFEPFS